MRITIIIVAAFVGWLPYGLADDDPSNSEDAHKVDEELKKALPNDSQRAKTARLELDYWHDYQLGFLSPPIRKSVKTQDGKAAEVLLLKAPAMSMPGTDFSMAFL